MPWYWPFGREAAPTPAPPPARRRDYAAAGFGRTMNDWVASSTSGDAELRTGLRTIRNRSRQLARDNDYVRNALRSIQNNVVGQGVSMQAQIKGRRGPGAGALNSGANSSVEDEWRKWKRADSCHTSGRMTFQGLERGLIRSVARDGEVFVRLISQRMGRSKVPLALEVLEADYLDENYNGTASNGNEIRMGIEVNKWMRPVAYWFYERHPGDYQSAKTGIQPRVRVPAEEVIHLARFEDERPGVTRGVPWFTSAMVRLRHMSGYEEAEIIAARATACQMGFITSPDPDYEPADDEIEDMQRIEVFEPGKIATLAPGEQFQAYNPTRPSGLLDPFMRYMLRSVAAGVGCSYESLSKDYSQSNYSSSRLSLLDDRDTWKELQSWLIDNLHQRVFERWIELAVLAGAVSLSGYELDPEAHNSPRWIARGWSWVDPAKEIAALKDGVRSGFMTMTDAVAQSGGDFDEMVVTRRRELDLCEKLELAFDTDPRHLDLTGKGQPSDPLDLSPPDPAPAPGAPPVDKPAPDDKSKVSSDKIGKKGANT